MVRNSSYREINTSEVVRNVLGPKFGIYEIFHEKMNPWKLYLTGVLAPKDADEDEDGMDNNVSGVAITEYGDQISENVDDPIKYSPNLDSKSQPRSMGISFVVSTTNLCPKFDLCLSWARYIWHQDWRELLKNNLDNKGNYQGWRNEEKMSDEFYMLTEEEEPKIKIDRKINPISQPNQKDSTKSNLITEDIPFGGWKREPHLLILKDVEICIENKSFLIEGNDLKEESEINRFYKIELNLMNDYEINIYFKIKELSKPNHYQISIYFLNESKRLNLKGKPRLEWTKRREEWVNRYIFQPQIRINCIENTKVEFFDLESHDNPVEYTEENNLKMLYYDLRPKARGHMCASIWKNIDPERETEKQNLIKTTDGPPFSWLDGDLIKQFKPHLWSAFTPPDIRSEFIPIIPISIPDFSWREFDLSNERWESKSFKSKEKLFLNPEYLAEKCWDSNHLKNILYEIVSEYRKWIEWKEEEIKQSFAEGTTLNWAINIAKSNIEKHKEIVKRIDSGIKEILKDNDTRLAFAFANKAISLQYKWKNMYKQGELVESSTPSRQFYWRPFQIAFILMSIPGVTNKTGGERDIVDIIWIPTGGGKTEAYLGVAAFTIAYRRRTGINGDPPERERIENGIYLISRYTLRLLTIQQYRRAVRMIVACEYLRVQNLKKVLKGDIIGWVPETLNLDSKDDNFDLRNAENGLHWLWGTTRISIGLWVGGTLTPNILESFYNPISKDYVYGAIEALRVGVKLTYSSKIVDAISRVGDPAQITKCPVCDCFLSLPKQKNQYLPEKMTLFPLVLIKDTDPDKLENKLTKINKIMRSSPFDTTFNVTRINSAESDFYSVGIKIKCTKSVKSDELKNWWDTIVQNFKGSLIPVNPDIRNPGYFYIFLDNSIIPYDKITSDDEKIGRVDFEIRCCNPICELNKKNWAELVYVNGNNDWTHIQAPWRTIGTNDQLSFGIPITAYTVDDQVYRKLPTMLIGTVDKFVQLSYKDEAGTIFGAVDMFHRKMGFFRNRALPYKRKGMINRESIIIKNLYDPPEIILQDEVHLIEGVLGSMVGIYETVIEELSRRYDANKKITHLPKYIASSATIRAGEDQVRSLFIRSCSIFPTSGINQKDSFFLLNQDLHPLDEKEAGRLYVGVCCAGKSNQKPFTHIWGQLFQTPFELKNEIYDDKVLTPNEKQKLFDKLDQFWTIVGYFNAIRELAGTHAIYSQEFITWMNLLYGQYKAPSILNHRDILGRIDDPIELSSRTDSVMLPNYFEKLDRPLEIDTDLPVNGLLTTSMFGTGVDVSRLGVMIVAGQPKTNASYIQATGRIGREHGGIVITYLNSKRPRDLDHYEQFSGYHLALYKNVEPITVSPFAPHCLNITIGPLLVALLRQSTILRNIEIDEFWRGKKDGPRNIFSTGRTRNGSGNDDYNAFLDILKERKRKQPSSRDFDTTSSLGSFAFNYEKWFDLIKNGVDLHYRESTIDRLASVSVVLGDPQHEVASKKENSNIEIVFKNAPNSLRGVESTITLGMWAKSR